MYEEKQLRLWLMSIPFSLLSFFGANAVIGKYDVFREKVIIYDKKLANRESNLTNCWCRFYTYNEELWIKE